LAWRNTRMRKRSSVIWWNWCRASIGQTGVTGSSGTAAAVVMRASRIAAGAKFFGYVPAAKFFCEQARLRSRS